MKASSIPERPTLSQDGFETVREAATFLSIGRSTLYKLMEAGDLPYAKFGKARRIPWRALRAYAERCLIGAGNGERISL
jgi:excisionase family DNA binding protein